MSNFTNVKRLNDLIGNDQGDLQAIDWDAASAQLEMIREEFIELQNGVDDMNIIEIRDAIADVLVTTYGLAHRLGIDADADMGVVHNSNMSKFCIDQKEALLTAQKYERMGIQVEYFSPDNTLIAVRSRNDQHDMASKFFPKGKLLKSINFHEPEFV